MERRREGRDVAGRWGGLTLKSETGGDGAREGLFLLFARLLLNGFRDKLRLTFVLLFRCHLEHIRGSKHQRSSHCSFGLDVEVLE